MKYRLIAAVEKPLVQTVHRVTGYRPVAFGYDVLGK